MTFSRFRPDVDLSSRRTISIELPEFLLRALECRVTEANEGASPQERVTVEHFVEIELAGSISLAEIAHLEPRVPGIGAAVSRWLDDIE
jgi:hypothetical protein